MDKKLTREGDEARDYVENIMSSQQVRPVQSEDTPKKSRKRNLSMPDMGDVSTKKVRAEDTNGRIMAQARRSLYGKTPATKTGREVDSERQAGEREADDTVDDPNEMIEEETGGGFAKVLRDISTELKRMGSRMNSIEKSLETNHLDLNERIDQLESRLEKRLSEKIAQIIDKRINAELKRLRVEIDSRFSDFKEDFQEEVSGLNTRFESLVESVNAKSEKSDSDIALNIVIRELPEHTGENTLAKVNAMFKEKLKVSDVSAVAAVRKQSSGTKPGVIVATLQSTEHKMKIMKAKRALRSTSFKNVFIHSDQNHADRVLNANIRKLVDAINSGDTTLTMKGNRVLKKGEHDGVAAEDFREKNRYDQNRGGDVSREHGGQNGHRSESVWGHSRGRDTRSDRSAAQNQNSGKNGYRSLFSGNRGGARGKGRTGAQASRR